MGKRSRHNGGSADLGKGFETVVVDANEFQDARRDPRVRRFLREAREYGARLTREQRGR